MTALDLDDIQGLILRGYGMPTARHLVLRIDDRDAFKAVLRVLATEDPGSGPYVTVAADWKSKPPIGETPAHCINIGFTFKGLEALGLPARSLESFPPEFVEGAVARSKKVGDTGPSAPKHWKGELASPAVHVLLSVFARKEALDPVTSDLRALLADQRAATELSCHEGRRLEGNVAHFGYRDGFSQPTIEGAPMAGLVDPLPVVPAGLFVLGQPRSHDGVAFYDVPQPAPLGRNGSYAAFRILEQDVDGFEVFLREEAPKAGMTEEMLAAKLCGRWRNGVPLVMSPETDSPDPPVSEEARNNFDYVPTEAWQGSVDGEGHRCPIGAHIRRTHPRSQRVRGSAHRRRLVRRGLPYGPEYNPAKPDEHERGLLGLFIAANLADQFEFLMKDWVNDGKFTHGLDGTKDPLLGDNEPAASRFIIPGEQGPVEINGFSRFVTTRGGAYCFLPSVTALMYMADLR